MNSSNLLDFSFFSHYLLNKYRYGNTVIVTHPLKQGPLYLKVLDRGSTISSKGPNYTSHHCPGLFL